MSETTVDQAAEARRELMTSANEELYWLQANLDQIKGGTTTAFVTAIDALMAWFWLVDKASFASDWLPGRHPDYVDEKWKLLQLSKPGFWDALDAENKVRLLKLALEKKLDGVRAYRDTLREGK